MINRALVYRSFGSPEEHLKLETSSLAARAAGMLRVAMLQVPINPSDLIPITGAYAHRITLPAIAGYEGVGLVTEAPPRYASLIGQRVLPLRGAGTWQSIVDCSPDLAVPVPDWISDDIAARSYINPLAACQLLRTSAVAGKRVLLCGAGSHCADLIGYWARREGAAEIVGLYRTEGRAERMRSLGIKPVSATNEEEVMRYARTADVTFDSLGGPLASRVIGAMRAGTRFVGYGLLTGQSVRPTRAPRATYERFHLRDTLRNMDPRAWQTAFGRIWATLGEIGLPPACFYPLEQWQRAVQQTGKPGAAKPIISFETSGT